MRQREKGSHLCHSAVICPVKWHEWEIMLLSNGFLLRPERLSRFLVDDELTEVTFSRGLRRHGPEVGLGAITAIRCLPVLDCHSLLG